MKPEIFKSLLAAEVADGLGDQVLALVRGDIADGEHLHGARGE